MTGINWDTLLAGGSGAGLILVVAFMAHKRVSDLSTALNDFRVKIAEQYVSLDQFREFETKIERRFDRLDEKLDQHFVRPGK